jgi:hypothetical protein
MYFYLPLHRFQVCSVFSFPCRLLSTFQTFLIVTYLTLLIDKCARKTFSRFYHNTVNKQQSLNLRFSSMFCIESKIVHVRAENIIMLYEWKVYVKFEDFCFTSDDAEDYASSEIWRKACISSYNLNPIASVSVAHW